jgi:hypothetical protein
MYTYEDLMRLTDEDLKRAASRREDILPIWEAADDFFLKYANETKSAITGRRLSFSEEEAIMNAYRAKKMVLNRITDKCKAYAEEARSKGLW